ncbi:MAG: hypothetical protein IJ877_08100 [Candidatus Gastranaerophilales bacterium]|nr:hypothetical protein [Candidatus Gastranaerophilales bacterium]
MDIIKKLFCFNEDDTSAIGLCKFNDDFFKMQDAKERFKKRIKKDTTLTQMLKRNA